MSANNLINELQDFKPYFNFKTTRFAPSPTGNLHIGGLRSALYNYAFAKQVDAKFVLRIEDTDRNRFVVSSLINLPKYLNYFGIIPDLMPDTNQILRSLNNDFNWYTHDWALHLQELENINFNDYKHIFIQSLRLSVYQKIAWYLVKKGWAYFCFCSKKRLEQVNIQKKQQGKQPGYDGYCKKTYTLDQALGLIKQGKKPVVRMNFDKFIEYLGTTEFVYHDRLLGDIKFDLKLQNDAVLLKSDGFPTYHLAVVVDDYLMNVHTTIRGYEWISSIPKHVLVAQALGIRQSLNTIHLPIILDPKGGKLSKRSGSVSVQGMLQEGYIKQAILNYLMTLGVSIVEDGKKPIFDMLEFLQKFSWQKTNTANPVFDKQKLLWFNKEYLSMYNKYDFERYFIYWLANSKQYVVNFLKDRCKLHDLQVDNCSTEFYQKIIDNIINSSNNVLIELLNLAKVRSYLMTDVLLFILPFYVTPKIIDYKNIKGVKRYEKNVLFKALSKLIDSFSTNWPKNNNDFVNIVRQTADESSIKHADLFMLIRLAVFGSSVSLPLFEFMVLLRKDNIIARLKNYLDFLKQDNNNKNDQL